MAFKVSQVGIDLIKQFEGCSLKAYLCPAKVWTIAYGRTGQVDGVLIKSGMTVTQSKAEILLMEDLNNSKYSKAVDKLNVDNQNQYNALISFCYNLGAGIFTGSLLAAIKAKNWDSVADQMLLYNKARVNGVLQPLAGLTRRRKAEAELLLKQEVDTTVEDKELSAAVSKIIKNNINIDYNSWKRCELIKLNNVPVLLIKLGGIDKLVADKVIGDKQLWITGKYNVNHVRSLIIKYASVI